MLLGSEPPQGKEPVLIQKAEQKPLLVSKEGVYAVSLKEQQGAGYQLQKTLSHILSTGHMGT